MTQLIFGSIETKHLLLEDKIEQEKWECQLVLDDLEHKISTVYTSQEISDWLFDHSECEPLDVIKLIRQLASNYTSDFLSEDNPIGQISDKIMEVTKGYN